jgi:L-aminoadipate-semialdehyde dehydrogenase
VFVPLSRMPLNPNGKIDKPALPFPDTAQAATAAAPERHGKTTKRKTSATEEAMQAIWSRILPNAPTPIPLDENFFDLGGHSILATRLIFEIRKAFVIDAPLGLVFDRPTIGALAAEVDTLRNADLGFAYKDEADRAPLNSGGLTVPGAKPAVAPAAVEYGKDFESLLPKLREAYAPLPANLEGRQLTIFLTGATGFLGAFILRDLLSRDERVKKVICLIRAKDTEQGLQRLRELSTDRGAWDDAWEDLGRLEVVIGDLNQPSFGLDKDTWVRVATEADVVLHNGALVSNTTI